MACDRTARLDGFEGRLTFRSANAGEWSADLEPDVLVHLLRAAAAGDEVSLDTVGGVHKVRIRRCWYDVVDQCLRAAFELSGISA